MVITPLSLWGQTKDISTHSFETVVTAIDNSPLVLLASPDCQRVLYLAKEDDKYFVVVDGKKQKNMTKSFLRFLSVRTAAELFTVRN